MSSEEISSLLSRYIATKILRQPKREILPEDVLISSGLIDSFNLVDLALFIEDTYQVRIDDTELNASTFDTLNQLVDLVQSRLP